MKRVAMILALFSSVVAFATDVNCTTCGAGGPPPGFDYPTNPGYPSDPYPSYPYPDYGSGFPGYPSDPFPSSPQPSYPQPLPPPPHDPQPAPQPRVCNTTTTCDSPCQWRPSEGTYKQICTVVNCRGEVVQYSLRSCIPTDEPTPAPRPQPRPQPQPQQPKPTPGQGQGSGQQKPGVQVVYEATATTVFKADALDSAQVPSSRKCMFNAGTIVEAKVLAVRADKLVKVILTADIDGCYGFGKAGQIGFLYSPHMLER